MLWLALMISMFLGVGLWASGGQRRYTYLVLVVGIAAILTVWLTRLQPGT